MKPAQIHGGHSNKGNPTHILSTQLIIFLISLEGYLLSRPADYYTRFKLNLLTKVVSLDALHSSTHFQQLQALSIIQLKHVSGMTLIITSFSWGVQFPICLLTSLLRLRESMLKCCLLTKSSWPLHFLTEASA